MREERRLATEQLGAEKRLVEKSKDKAVTALRQAAEAAETNKRDHQQLKKERAALEQQKKRASGALERAAAERAALDRERAQLDSKRKLLEQELVEWREQVSHRDAVATAHTAQVNRLEEKLEQVSVALRTPQRAIPEPSIASAGRNSGKNGARSADNGGGGTSGPSEKLHRGLDELLGAVRSLSPQRVVPTSPPSPSLADEDERDRDVDTSGLELAAALNDDDVRHLHTPERSRPPRASPVRSARRSPAAAVASAAAVPRVAREYAASAQHRPAPAPAPSPLRGGADEWTVAEQQMASAEEAFNAKLNEAKSTFNAAHEAAVAAVTPKTSPATSPTRMEPVIGTQSVDRGNGRAERPSSTGRGGPAAADVLFDALDDDGDGVITKQEMREGLARPAAAREQPAGCEWGGAAANL